MKTFRVLCGIAAFAPALSAQVTFTKDSAGIVTGLALHQNGAHQPAKKRP